MKKATIKITLECTVSDKLTKSEIETLILNKVGDKFFVFSEALSNAETDTVININGCDFYAVLPG